LRWASALGAVIWNGKKSKPGRGRALKA